jgi:hypothetical protein
MLYLLLFGKKKRKGKKGQGTFFPGQIRPIECATLGFSQLLGATERYFKC